MKKNVLLAGLLLGQAYAQAQTNPTMSISGTVRNEAGEMAEGVTVSNAARKKVTLTDANGRFKIDARKDDVLTFSAVGFKTIQYKVTDGDALVISLTAESAELDDVVVIGYGTQKKSSLTGAVSKIKTDNLNQIPVSRADLALIGKAAGVRIQVDNAQAGAEPTIQIRGATSVTAGTQPLLVVDGYPVPSDLSSIDMNDIESVEILKDAASAAIYGSRGGNGVILITTKKGKIGKAKTSLNVSRGVKQRYRKVEVYDLASWTQYVLQDNKGVLSQNILDAQRVVDSTRQTTDAQDIIFRTANFTNAQASISGGSPNIRYYFSGNMALDQGIYLGNDYERFTLRAGIDAKLSSRIDAGISFNPTYSSQFQTPFEVHESVRNLPNWMPLYHTDYTANITGKPVGSVASQRDFDPGRNPNYTGAVNLGAATTNNGLISLQATTDQTTSLRNITTAYINVKLARGLNFRTSGNAYTNEETREYFQKSFSRADPILDGIAFARLSSNAYLQQTKTLDLLNENLLEYKNVFAGKHDLAVIGGFTAQYTQTDFFRGSANNFATDDIPTLNAGNMQSLTSTREKEGLVSFLGRVNYAYDNRYLLSVSFRTDGSSRFGANNRYASFPAASVGWNLGREKFFKANDFVNEVKLRASYGATGNKNIPNYRPFANVNSANYELGGSNINPGFAISSFANPDLSWERTFSLNTGLDLTLFKRRLDVSVEYYNTTTDQLLLNLPLASATGFPSYAINRGKVRNQGFELEFTARAISRKDFRYEIAGNIFTNHNELLDFGGIGNQIIQGDPRRPNYFVSRVGEPLVQFYGYRVDSLVSMQGTNYWPIGVQAQRVFAKDINGDGLITDDDRTVLGNPYPKFNWGTTHTFTYKDFDVSFVLQGSHGASVFNIDPHYYETVFGTTGSGAHQKYSPALQATTRLKSESDYHIQDASFVALRNLNIGYSFKGKKGNRLGLNRVRIYASSANLWYQFSDSYTSLNPEANSTFRGDPLRLGYQRGATPIARTITFGTNISF